MEGYIPCTNIKCSLNRAYKKENVEEKECFCSKLTFKNLQCRVFCEEREWGNNVQKNNVENKRL